MHKFQEIRHGPTVVHSSMVEGSSVFGNVSSKVGANKLHDKFALSTNQTGYSQLGSKGYVIPGNIGI